MNTQALERITTPHHRKGSTEEHIFAENRRAKTTAKLMAEVERQNRAVAAGTSRHVQQALDVIAGRVS